MRMWKWLAVMAVLGVVQAAPVVTEGLGGRVRVLYIADSGPHHTYAGLDFLERQTDLRFIYQRNSSPTSRGMDESAAICDGLLWDSAGFPAQQTQRLETLAGYLERAQFEMIVLDGKEHLPRIQDAIVAYVREGGTLVWLGTRLPKEGDAGTATICQLCPWQAEDEAATKRKVRVVQALARKEGDIGIESLAAGAYPLAQMIARTRRASAALLPGPGSHSLARWEATEHGLLAVMPFGKGRVIGFAQSQLVPPAHTMGSWQTPDRELLWARFWEHVGRCAKAGGDPFGDELQVKLGTATVAAGASVQVELPKAARVALTAPDGTVVAEGAGTVVALAVPAGARSGAYLVTATGDGAATAYAVCRVTGNLAATLTSDRHGVAVGGVVTFTANLSSRAAQAATVDFVIRDGMGIAVHHERRTVELAAAPQDALFSWTMPDYGVDGWAFHAEAVVTAPQGRERADVWFWRYEPWTMREKILISNYYAGSGNVPAAMMPLFAGYHRGIGYSAAHHWEEPYLSRFNMRAWYQHAATMMETYTSNFRQPGFAHLRDQVERNFDRDPRLHSAAWVIRDFGEETGFYYHWSNNPFARTWKTAEDIPEGAHRLFQVYLKERYGDIAKLNDEWEREFAAFDEIKLDPSNGYPAGWLHPPPPPEMPANLAPILDTHGFFFWYTQRVAETYTGALRELNPTADWGMSFSLTFNLFSPVPMTMTHPMYNAQVLEGWNDKASRRSQGGNTPLFSFHWGFDEDPRGWGQFWNNSLVSGATFISNWGSQFNFDLTHSRSTILLKRLMARVRPREKFFLDLYPVDDYDVGIYHPDLDWQTIHSRPQFYLKAQGPNAAAMGQLGYKSTGTGWLGGPENQIYMLLASSGYTPRFVTADEIPKCRVLVVPYVETMPVEAAARIRQMVAAGGMLVTMPVLAQFDGYGKPFATVPGAGLDEVVGLTVTPDILGQRSVVILPREDEDIQFRFTPRVGSEPPYLWSYGYQHVVSLAEGTRVVLRNYANEPMLTVHPFGEGRAIHLNAFTFHHWGNYELSQFQEESLRQLLDSFVRTAGVEPALFVERPFRYGEGINDWAQYQYELKGSGIRVLALYGDKMAQRILGQVVLNQPVAEVYDILAGERVPLRQRGGGRVVEELEPFAFTTRSASALRAGTVFPVELGPGEAAFYAILPYAAGNVELTVQREADGLAGKVRVLTAAGEPVPGAHPVEWIVEDANGMRLPMLCRKLTVPGELAVRVPIRLGDPAGTWTVTARDCITAREARQTVSVPANPSVAAVPAAADVVNPSAVPRRIAINDTEFVGLLAALRELYRTGGDRDKGSLSYYVHDRDVSRHRVNQLLGQADWSARLPALRTYLEAGNTVVLLGEDMGRDPATGLVLDPFAGQDASMDMSVGGELPAVAGAGRRAAIVKLCGRDVFAEPWPDGRLTVPFGRGRLILDTTSFDDLGQMNGHFLLNHARWLGTMDNWR